MTREAACSCGQLRVRVEGDPVRISLCHCLACKRRTGSAFGYQARFLAENAEIEGRHTDYTRRSDEGGQSGTFSFCPDCGATVFYTSEPTPELIAVPVGAFADPAFPPPTVSVYESRRHAWVALPADIEHDD
ncbi:MAG: GFA family protein [Gaiellaceae bacterium]